jgi:hypothetical protein
MQGTTRRLSYIFLCALPFLLVVVAGARALRTQGVYQGVGIVLFALILVASWPLGMRVVASGTAQRRAIALAGSLFLLPWAVIALLWVGIGAPFQATPAENQMRFFVLIGSSVVMMSAFVALKEALSGAGERFYSTLGVAAGLTAGMAYLLCLSLSFGVFSVRLRSGKAPAIGDVLANFYSILELVACISTYCATAAFATALGKARWLGRGASRGYAGASMVFLLFLLMRGVSYPEISAATAPWYTQPGVIAGIPAVPWLMPGLLGVVLLRRAGDENGDDRTRHG